MKKYKFLFCDLDGTLINTVSGKTFAEDVMDFRIRKNVLDKIKELNEINKLAFVAIVTNQGGIPQYVSENDFYAKLTTIKTFLSTNIQECLWLWLTIAYLLTLTMNIANQTLVCFFLRVVRSYEETFFKQIHPRQCTDDW